VRIWHTIALITFTNARRETLRVFFFKLLQNCWVPNFNALLPWSGGKLEHESSRVRFVECNNHKTCWVQQPQNHRICWNPPFVLCRRQSEFLRKFQNNRWFIFGHSATMRVALERNFELYHVTFSSYYSSYLQVFRTAALLSVVAQQSKRFKRKTRWKQSRWGLREEQFKATAVTFTSKTQALCLCFVKLAAFSSHLSRERSCVDFHVFQNER